MVAHVWAATFGEHEISVEVMEKMLLPFIAIVDNYYCATYYWRYNQVPQ